MVDGNTCPNKQEICPKAEKKIKQTGNKKQVVAATTPKRK
jgi:hypothetical protein